ncbi:MAG: O-antigen ligase family protein [Chloroflexota bacterium]
MTTRGTTTWTSTATSAPSDAFGTSRLRQLLLFLVAIKIAGILLIFDPWGLQSFDLPKTLFSHTVAWILGATTIAALLVYGAGIVPRTRLHLAVAAYVLANLLSALFAENAYLAVFGDQDRYLGLGFVADMVVLYLAVAVGFRSAKDLPPFFAALGVATLLVFAYALVQAAQLDPLPWLGATAQPFSTLGHPDMLGHFLSIVFALCVVVALVPQLGFRGAARAAAAAAASLSVLLAAVIATRGTLLGFGAALAVVMVLELRLRGLSRSTATKFLLTAVVAVGLCIPILALSPLGARMANVLDDRGSGRVALYDAALQATLARPVVGWGPDNFASAYPAFRQPQPYGGVNPESSAHDWLLQASVTTGALGVGALLAMLLAFAVALWRVVMVRSASVAALILGGLAAYYTHGLVAVGSISVDWFPWFCFGLIASTTGLSSSATARRVRPAPLGPIGLFAAALLAAAAIALPISAFQANRHAGAARAELLLGRPERAVSAAESAVSTDSGRSAYWRWLGLSREKMERWREAAEGYEEAAVRAPHDATYWSSLARARRNQALAKDEPELAGAAAVQAALRAVAVDPYGLGVNESLADLAYEFGDFDIALRAAVKTVVIYDGYPTYGHRALQAAERVTDLPGARRVLEEAVTLEETTELRLALAVTALRMNDRPAARESALRALALAPNSQEALRLLAQLDR